MRATRQQNSTAKPDLRLPPKEDFGIEGYTIHKAHYMDPKEMNNPSWKNQMLGIKPGESRKKTFIDDVVRFSLKHNFPPAKLDQVVWTKEQNSMVNHGHAHKDEFRKGERLTLPAQLMREGFKLKAPDMCTYNPIDQQKVRNFALVLSEKC
jgi:hypothetical protein